MKATLDVLAILAASIVNLVAGVTITNIGRVHTRLFSEMDMELPLISKASAAYTATVAPIIVGLILGIATLAGLGFIFRSERLRWMLPFLLSISFIVAILHIMFVSFGVTLPLVRITYTMGQ
jgi:uncharacterized membrane protein